MVVMQTSNQYQSSQYFNNKMQSVENTSVEKTQSYCKNHPNLLSGYFLADQPSIKYCKNCALNVALCGRKIEKQLTLQEQKRKQEITAIVNQLKRQLAANTLSQTLNKETEMHFKEMGKPFEDRIKKLQGCINELISLKQNLCKIYEEKFVKQTQNLVKVRQTNCNNHLQIEKLLQRIESNFGNLIETEDSQQLQKQMKEWNETIAKTTESLMKQQSFAELRLKAFQGAHQLFQMCDKISNFRVNFQDINLKVCLPIEQNKENFIPILQFNCLESSRLVEELKINLTANAQLKSKNARKVATDRDHPQFNKKSNKKQSIVNEGISDWVIPSRKVHQK